MARVWARIRAQRGPKFVRGPRRSVRSGAARLRGWHRLKLAPCHLPIRHSVPPSLVSSHLKLKPCPFIKTDLLPTVPTNSISSTSTNPRTNVPPHWALGTSLLPSISPDSSTKKARVSCRHGRGGCIHLLRAISSSPIRTFPATQSYPRYYHPPWRTHPTSSSSTRPWTAWPTASSRLQVPSIRHSSTTP